ncbi:MAG: sigma-54-dependent Fis family transcriptional regulator [Candidatus Margulisbacteria bacterium]|nr:sigma-54-dependent Fis family transcriptional regulator [Candidatus Margulisiibacteriota bacterium]
MEKKKVLVIDDEPNIIASIKRLLTDKNIHIYEANNGKEGLKLTFQNSPEIIIVDYKMPEMNGLEFIKAVQTVKPDIPIIVMTAHGDKNTALQFLKEGAFRYLEKPFRPEEFTLVVQEALTHYALILENEKLQQISKLEHKYSELIGNSPPMIKLYSLIEKIAKTDITVLIQGESGTGKELIAKAIHEKSNRASKPFIRFNCAALPETLMESELFGHEKGAFTGAEKQKLGRFELAEAGTIFLDEIGELSLPMQVKLLRILQEREFERVGGVTTIKANVRVIAATNQNFETMIEQKQFREDLYYRLNSFPIHAAPLRERGDDVIMLATYFLEAYSTEYNVKIKSFSEAAKKLLKNYHWKGNVRELQNIVSRAVILCSGNEITENLLPLETGAPSHFSNLEKLIQEHITEDTLVKRYAQEVYKRCNHNKKDTANWLQINYRTLMTRLGF